MPNGTILVVDDVEYNRRILDGLLRQHGGYDILQVADGLEALAIARQTRLDLVLLDINMPNLDGFETCIQLKADSRTRPVPVIFVSSSDESLDKVRAFGVGGIDYVTKPLHIPEVLARVNSHVALYRQQRELEVLRQEQIRYLESIAEIKDKFMRGVSHDLKNPLGIIIGAVETLRESPLTEEQVQLVDIIERKAGFMLAIISDLLDIARIEAGYAPNRAPISLHLLVQEALVGFDLLAERKQINLLVQLPANDTEVNVERHALCRVIANLVANALKYTAEGGTVALEASTEDDHLSIIVRDNGFGIPEEALPHLFEKFYRVPQPNHAEEEGTGLGLAIAKAIVEQHDGTINVETTLGEGSTFSVRLPLHGRNAK